ncbi:MULTISPECIES: DUF202 domain-containing protein [unclassified Leptolyngbya]|uniref:YidH family protein n=1 Tax=unclassified Leptolyngbya TaxID=2650499 RepID=UPI0016858ABB|nr:MULTISPECIES: DUF202 domain-containing protein [unclassified Leptolyngbya]MBD1910388.1 DUF202 domain-containing protein [Leptolyngbya sp. FACHB-8]MBD2157784.1 DUF202 domain-containing protein [Leptolyngbya sp. FACHB-16]
MRSLEQLSETVNELAKERNRAAAERTLGAWITSSIHLIGFGIAIDQIYIRVFDTLPDKDPLIVERLAQKISLVFMVVSIIMLAIAMIQHSISVQSLERDDNSVISSTKLNLIATATVIGFGVVGVLVIFLGL